MDNLFLPHFPFLSFNSPDFYFFPIKINPLFSAPPNCLSKPVFPLQISPSETPKENSHPFSQLSFLSKNENLPSLPLFPYSSSIIHSKTNPISTTTMARWWCVLATCPCSFSQHKEPHSPPLPKKNEDFTLYFSHYARGVYT